MVDIAKFLIRNDALNAFEIEIEIYFDLLFSYVTFIK